MSKGPLPSATESSSYISRHRLDPEASFHLSLKIVVRSSRAGRHFLPLSTWRFGCADRNPCVIGLNSAGGRAVPRVPLGEADERAGDRAGTALGRVPVRLALVERGAGHVDVRPAH